MLSTEGREIVVGVTTVSDIYVSGVNSWLDEFKLDDTSMQMHTGTCIDCQATT